MSNIQSYIERLKIKKALFGGFDKESVYTSMMELDSVYQKEMIKLKEEMIQLKEEKEQIEKENLSITNDLNKAKKVIATLKYKLEEEQKNKNNYDLRCSTLSQAIDAINVSKEKIIEEAKKTAAGIITDAYEKNERINMEYLIQKQQKDLLLSKVVEVKQHYNNSMENIRSVLTKMLLEVEDLQKVGIVEEFDEGETADRIEDSKNQTILNSNTNRLVKMMAGSVNEYDS